MTITLKCPNCGAPAKYERGPGQTVTCEYCGGTIVVPEELRPAGEAPQAPEGGAGLNATQLEEVVNLIRGGQKIEAIKRIREWTGLKLAPAKDIADRLEAGLGVAALVGDASGYAQPVATPSPRRTGCGAVLAPMALAVVIIGIALYAFRTSLPNLAELLGGKNPNPLSTGLPKLISPFNRVNFDTSATLVPGADAPGARPDILVRAFHVDAPDAERYKLIWVDTQKSDARWRFTTSLQARFATGPEVVVVADKTRLIGLDRVMGSTLWEATLPDQLAGPCANCLTVIGQRIVAVTNDGQLTGYDVKTGRKVWSQRLSALNRLMLLGEQLLVLERTNKDPYAVQATVLDVDGKTQGQFAIQCVQQGQSRPIVGYTYEGYAVDAASKSLYAWYGSPNSCLQKYDLATGKLTWSAPTKARSTQHDDAAMLVADGRVFAGGSTTLVTGDGAGKVTELMTDPDYDLRPYAAQGDTLVIRAQRTRGTRRWELWGVDIATGSRQWQVIFDKDGGPMREPDRASGLLSKDRDDEIWSANLTPGGLAIVRVSAKPSLQATVEVVGLKDGVSAGRKALPLKTGSLLVSIPTEIEWRGDTAWLLIDNTVYAINTKSAAVEYQVP